VKLHGFASGRYRLGIDFGTSSTVGAIVGADGRARLLLFDASPLLPSAVFVGPGRALLTGMDAVRAGLSAPAALEPNPKRCIDDGTVWLGEQEVEVVDLLAATLSRIGGEARRVAGQAPAGVVLTHPATWSRVRIGVLAEAARRAGLAPVSFVAEPVAAAAYFVSVLGRRVPPSRCLVVYDLGAGTFDVSVVQPTADGFQVVAAGGLDDVGGLDLDAAVVAHARSLTSGVPTAWSRLDWPESGADQQARHALWRDARAAKEQLSRHAVADLHVPLLDTDVHLTREELEKAATPLLERTATLTLRVLRDAAIPPEQVGGVFLVGGSSRIPLAATLLHRALRIAPTALDQPELVVAEGSLLARASAAGPWQAVAAPAPPTSAGQRPAVIARPAVPMPPSAPPPTGIGPAGPSPEAAPLPRTGAPDKDAPPDDALASPGADVPVHPVVHAARGPSDITPERRQAAPGAERPSRDPATKRRARRLSVVAVVVVLLVTAGITLVALRPWNRPPSHRDVRLTTTLPGRTGGVRAVAFRPLDGSRLVSAGDDEHITQWDVAGHAAVEPLFLGHTGVIFGVAYSPDGATIASVSEDNSVRLWRADSHQQIGAALEGHTSNVRAVAFSRDGSTIATSSDDHTIRLWSVTSHQETARLTGPNTNVLTVALSPDGRTVASGSDDKRIRLWSVATQTQIGGDVVTPAPVLSVAFSPNGKMLASGGQDTDVRLWDVPIGSARSMRGHTDWVNSVAFSADSKTVASGSSDGTLRLWAVASGTQISDSVTDNAGAVRCVAFSPNGRTLASAGDDRNIRIWTIS
jgi:WD40 repeat protein